jgi:hypothetical protein
MVGFYYSATGDPKRKKSNPTGLFLLDQVLGLVSCLTDIFNIPPDSRSIIEEHKRSIKALEELLRIGKRNIRMARPQVSLNSIQVLQALSDVLPDICLYLVLHVSR